MLASFHLKLIQWMVCETLSLSSNVFLDHSPHYPLRQAPTCNLELACESRMVASEPGDSCVCLSSAGDKGATTTPTCFTPVQGISSLHVASTSCTG